MKENEPKKVDDLGKRRGAFLIYFILQLVVFYISFKFYIPFFKNNDFLGMFIVLCIYFLIMFLGGYLVKKVSDIKLEGASCILIGTFILAFVFGDFIKGFLVIVGTQLVSKGVAITKLESHPIASRCLSMISRWNKFIKR